MIRWTLTLFAFLVIALWGSSYIWSIEFIFPYAGQGRDIEITSLTGRLSVTVQTHNLAWSHGYGLGAFPVRQLREKIRTANEVGIPMEMPENYDHFLWREDHTVTTPQGHTVSWTTSALPYWVIAIAVGGFPVWLWVRRLSKKQPGGHVCQECGYDLRGSPSPICSECGFADKADTGEIKIPS